ncbi:hypothetical protein AMJ49_04520 [Parcubacteria bacterium DG_74_2]|nr:MAG: hypothetical protein AMJ49_04520 [Parcubacteria bacterium DG_74_2]
MKYQLVIGLEIHAELNTESKMFCSCLNNPDESQVNVNVCPICLGHPGTLPVINKRAVELVIKTGLALNCSIPKESKFDRKNYFYPDLPKGYQISQYDKPIARQGELKIKNQKSKIKTIRIERIHLEEDTGKLIHPEGTDYSLIDFNRAGIPLMELVTEPDLRSGEEAKRFAQGLQLILRYLNVSEANMEKGEMRVEVNISLSQDSKLGTKVEIKNLNSFRSVERAVEYEIKRQAKILESGKKVIQETRGWHDIKQKTFSQREKEESHDYRYFPEPDLPILRIKASDINKIRAEIPELPQQRRERFQREYGLLDKEVYIFVRNKELGEYFEKVLSEIRNWVKEIEIKNKVEAQEFERLIKLAVNYILTDLQGLLKGTPHHKKNGGGLITPENFAEFVVLIYKGKISSKIAKQVLVEMFKTGADPSHIIEKKDLIQLTDTDEIEKIVKQVISQNPKPVEDYKKGKQNALQFLVGKVMAATKGKANPETVNKILKKIIVI